MNLKNKVVLITGANRGIGAETARYFAKEKSILVITYVSNKREIDKVAKQCKNLGAKDVFVQQLDIRNNYSLKRAVHKTIKKYKRIDILINNAGYAVWKPLIKQSFKEIETQIKVNLEGLIKITRVVLPYMIKKKNGVIVNIGSGASKHPHPTLSVYCATKFGVRGFTQTLAEETKRSGVRIYLVNPDKTKTKMTNFKGRPVSDVAEIVLNTAKEKVYNKLSGGEVDVWVVKPL